MGKKLKQAKNHDGKKGLLDEESPQNKAPKARKKNAKQNKRKGIHSSVCDDEDVQFRKSLEADGRYSILEMEADGNCLFRALSDQLFHDHGSRHAEIRSAVCDFIQEHEEEFSVFLVLDEDEEDEDAKDFETYIINMKQDGEWGGNLELVAAARLFRRNIVVFSETLSAFTINHGMESAGEGDAAEGNLHLSYHDNYHYSSVRDNRSPQKTLNAKEILEDLPIDNPKLNTKNEKEAEEAGNRHENVSPCEDSSRENIGNDQQKTPTRRKVKKNDSCPCGSGKKYKKCCFAREKHAARVQKLRQDCGFETEPNPQNGNSKKLDEGHEMNGQFRVLQI